MNYIYNETLSGVVDGINTEFTTQYPIYKIEEVYLGGVAYRNISFSGNVVTFSDAPPIGSSPSIDYFEATTPPPISESEVTLGLIIEDIYDKLVQNRVSEGIPNDVYKESQIKKNIVTGYRRIKNKSVYKDKISSYSFRSAKALTTRSEDNINIEVGEFINIPNNGAGMFISGAIFNYTNYNNGILNSDLNNYNRGDKLIIGYKLPSAALKVSEVLINGFPLEYKDTREYAPNRIYYTIINGYIFLPYSEREDIVVVKYIPKYNQLLEDEDLIDLEYDYFELLSYYTLYKICQLVEDDRWQVFEKEYKELLRDYKSYKSRAVDGINNRFKSNVLNNIK